MAAVLQAEAEGEAPAVPVFDGHNDFLLRLWSDPPHRERLWLERNPQGHLRSEERR